MDALPVSYQLYIEIIATVKVTVGRLGTFDFPPGNYVYTGSAKKNIDARIARHLRTDKKLRWHIDYLLADPQVNLARVVKHCDSECSLNQSVNGVVVVKGFGSSDCNSNCGSHLKMLRTPGPRPGP